MCPEYCGDWTDWSKNIMALAGHLDAQIATLQAQRDRIASGVSHPELRANDIAAVDAQLKPLVMKARAARDGKLLWDPGSITGSGREHQRWVVMASKAGALVTPSTYAPSVHESDADATELITVARGR